MSVGRFFDIRAMLPRGMEHGALPSGRNGASLCTVPIPVTVICDGPLQPDSSNPDSIRILPASIRNRLVLVLQFDFNAQLLTVCQGHPVMRNRIVT